MRNFRYAYFVPAALIVLTSLTACAYPPYDRYNTQRGALIGAGSGALIGQAIGRNTEGTLIGLGVGTLFGALLGNAVDQDYEAARQRAPQRSPVVYAPRPQRTYRYYPRPHYGYPYYPRPYYAYPYYPYYPSLRFSFRYHSGHHYRHHYRHRHHRHYRHHW